MEVDITELRVYMKKCVVFCNVVLKHKFLAIA